MTIEFVTDKNPIRNINTVEVKLSEADIKECIKVGLKRAYALNSNPCISKIELELFKSVNQKINKPRF